MTCNTFANVTIENTVPWLDHLFKRTQNGAAAGNLRWRDPSRRRCCRRRRLCVHVAVLLLVLCRGSQHLVHRIRQSFLVGPVSAFILFMNCCRIGRWLLLLALLSSCQKPCWYQFVPDCVPSRVASSLAKISSASLLAAMPIPTPLTSL